MAFGYGRLFTGHACTSGKHSVFYLEGSQDIRRQTYGLLLYSGFLGTFCWFVSPNMAVCFDSHNYKTGNALSDSNRKLIPRLI